VSVARPVTTTCAPLSNASTSGHALDALAHGRERLARVHVAQLDAARDEVVEPVQHVVAGDGADAEAAREPEVARDPAHGRGAPLGVDAARVRRHADVALDARGQNLAHQRHEVARVARRGVARALLLHDRHRDLGQVVEHQVVYRPPLDLPHGRVEHVAPEALAAGDADHLSLLTHKKYGATFSD
jgi:hypothetical protein